MVDLYRAWLSLPEGEQPPTYYQLLGIAPTEERPEVIHEATLRQTARLRAFQTGPYAQECTRLLNEIARAKLTLLNPARRAEYDASLARPTPVLSEEPFWGRSEEASESAFVALASPPATTVQADPRVFAFQIPGPAGGRYSRAASRRRPRARGWGTVSAVMTMAVLLAVAFGISFWVMNLPGGTSAEQRAADRIQVPIAAPVWAPVSSRPRNTPPSARPASGGPRAPSSSGKQVPGGR